MHRVINTHVEAIKIGRQIAEQALDTHRKTEGSGETHFLLLYLSKYALDFVLPLIKK